MLMQTSNARPFRWALCAFITKHKAGDRVPGSQFLLLIAVLISSLLRSCYIPVSQVPNLPHFPDDRRWNGLLSINLKTMRQ